MVHKCSTNLIRQTCLSSSFFISCSFSRSSDLLLPCSPWIPPVTCTLLPLTHYIFVVDSWSVAFLCVCKSDRCVPNPVSVCSHLVAVSNQLGHRCVHFVLVLQGSEIMNFEFQMQINVFSVLQISVCSVLQKVWSCFILLLVVQIWACVLLHDLGFANCGKVLIFNVYAVAKNCKHQISVCETAVRYNHKHIYKERCELVV